MRINRREFIGAAATLAAAAATSSSTPARELPAVTPGKLPRWRGFNLLEKFTRSRNGNGPFQPLDFELMEEWGFDFARLPMSYQCWSEPDPAAWLQMREDQLKHIDEAVELGLKHKIHINLNLHRAPGYCVNPPAEPLSLWKDQQALDASAHHWAAFARRYKGIPNERLSFDLLNEPPNIAEETYAKVVRSLVAAIRAEDPSRLIVADGLKWGRDPVHSLADLRIGQSTRGYDPMQISHYKASWVNGSDKWAEPAWPLRESEKSSWDKERLRRERIEPWKELERKGVGVHVGEWGSHNRTPHAVALAWMRTQLELWQEAGWGWALWNLRGSFGVMDSGRSDVPYEDLRGHKLDRAMLDLIRRF